MALQMPDWVTDKIWYAMCDCNMSLPEPLEQADLSRPFVYDRKYGVFAVPSGKHQGAMSLLLAIQNGCTDSYEVAKMLGISTYSVPKATADHYLKSTFGAAFRSSIGSQGVFTWTPKHLTEKEKDYFGKSTYINP